MSRSEERVINFFESLADKTRLRIILSIAESPKTVNEIHRCVGKNKMTLSAISHQLKQLSNIKIVKAKKKGREKLFTLSDNFCWCVLKDAFGQFGNKIKIKCKKCTKVLGNK